MQAELSVFTKPDTDTNIDRTVSSPEGPPAGEQPAVFAGEINTELMETAVRHLTGYFDHILFRVTSDGMTFKPYVTKNEENAFSQVVTLPADDWETFEIAHDTEYIAAVDPYSDLYQVFAGRDSITDTVSITVNPVGDAEVNWEDLQAHSLYDPNHDAGTDRQETVDSLTVAGEDCTILRNPSRELLTVDELSYHTDLKLDATYESKSWLTSTASNHGDDSVILVAATTGDRARDPEHVLSFSVVDTDNWETIGEPLVLTANSTGFNNEDPDISNVRVGGTRSRPKARIEQCLPDEHDQAIDGTWGFYRLGPLAGMFKHVLKDSLTSGTYTFEMSSDFPLQVTHDLSTAVETDTTATVTNMLAPVVSP